MKSDKSRNIALSEIECRLLRSLLLAEARENENRARHPYSNDWDFKRTKGWFLGALRNAANFVSD